MPRNRYPHITKGTDGSWHAWVTVGTKPNGRPDQRHVKRKTREGVEDRVDELLDQRRDDAVPKPGRGPTVEQLFETYFETTAVLKLDPTTIDGFRSKMRNNVYPVIGHRRAGKIGADDLEAIYVQMRRNGSADSTVLQVHRIISRILEVARRRKSIPRNVTNDMDAPTAKVVEIKPPTEDEAGRLLDATAQRRNRARWRLGLGLGLRQGEALGLRWEYVDLDSAEPSIEIAWQLSRRAFKHGCGGSPCGRRRAGNCPKRWLPLRSGETQVQGGLILKRPKGDSMGVIPLPPELVEELRAQREMQDLEKMLAEGAYAPSDFVFTGVLGGPVSPEADWAEWQELEAAAGVEGKYRPHDARHYAGTFLLGLGVDVRVVQKILRHSTVKMTERYTHVVDRMAREAVEQMGRAMPRAKRLSDG